MNEIMNDKLNDSAELVQKIEKEEPQEFTIIGSGIVGISVARELAQKGRTVRVISVEGKPALNTDSASAIAIGQFLPWLPEGHAATQDLNLQEVVDATRSFYEVLASNPHETGVMKVSNVELVNADHPWPDGLPEAMNVVARTLAEPIRFPKPDGTDELYDKEYIFDTFSIDVRKTLAFLADQAEKEGVRFEQKKMSPEELEYLDGITINAGGSGAYEFDPTRQVKNYKGHTFILRPKQGYVIPKQALSVEDLIVMPREDGSVVCGALYLEDPSRPIPEESEAKELLKRLGRLIKDSSPLVEGLDPELLAHCDIMSHSAGYRVDLEGGGMRIAKDEHSKHLLHAYGFSGVGWSVGPHLAKRIAGMALDMHDEGSNT